MKFFLFLTFSFLLFSYSQSQIPNQKPTPQKNAINKNPNRQFSAPLNPKTTTNPITVIVQKNGYDENNWTLATKLTFIGLLITGVIGGVGIRQARISQDSNQRQNRAYLSIEPNVPDEDHPFGKNTIPIAGQPHQFFMKVTNWGQTPAKRMNIKIGIETLQTGPTKQIIDSLGKGISGLTAISPRQSITHSTPPHIFTRQDITDWKENRKKLMIFGVITYEDVFGKKDCRTQFCFHIQDETYGSVISSTEGFNSIE